MKAGSEALTDVESARLRELMAKAGMKRLIPALRSKEINRIEQAFLSTDTVVLTYKNGKTRVYTEESWRVLEANGHRLNKEAKA